MARDTDGIIPVKYANSGDVGLGGLDINELWTITYSTPGGLFPQRIQFNQLFRNLSALAVEINLEGPFLEYSSAIDYSVKSVVKGSDGVFYKCLIANGPSSSVVDPVGDVTGTWTELQPFRLLSDYASLSAAITAIGATETELWIDKDDTLTGSVTIPTTLSIRPVIGNVITTDSNTFIINGAVIGDPLFQWLSGSGVAVNQPARPEWWGAKADNSDASAAANSLALTLASTACNAAISPMSVLLLSSGVYRVTSTAGNFAVTFNSPVMGQSPIATVIRQIGNGNVIYINGQDDVSAYLSFKNFSVYGNASGSGTGITISLSGTPLIYARFDGVDSHDNAENGIIHQNGWASKYIDCKFYNNGSAGVLVINSAGDTGVSGSSPRKSGNANGVMFVNCEARHNGGTGNNTADFTKGGLLVASATNVNWIGGIIESNNAWGVIVGDPNAEFIASSINISNVYAEDQPASFGTSTIGGFIKAFAAWENLCVEKNIINYGTGSGVTSYGFLIEGDLGTDENKFTERNNQFIFAGVAAAASTSIRKFVSNVVGDKDQAVQVKTFNIESGKIALVYETGDTLVANGVDWTGASGAVPPDNWSVIAAGLFDIINDGAPHTVALRIQVNATPTANPSMNTTALTSVKVGSKYMFSFNIKVNNASVNVYLGNSGAASTEYKLWSSLTGATWTKYYHIFTATETPVHFAFLLNSAVAGENFYVDDVELKLVAPYEGPNVLIDTEAAAASDDLTEIYGGTEGQLIRCSAVDSTRSVVFKNGTPLKLGSDFTADNADDVITLERVSQDVWRCVSKQDNGA